MNIDKAIEEFMIYTKPYIAISDKCALKIDHTLRVVKLCEEIAKSLNFSDEEVNVAKMIGLLHDIGRFEQWKKYQTFNDLASADHAHLGVEILTANNYIRNYYTDSKYDNIVLSAIAFHNKYKLPNGLSEKEKLFSKIIRDADKLDILYLYTIGHININTEEQKMTDKIYSDLISGKEIRREDKRNKADNLSISLGFIFDINFKKSLEILKDENYLNKEIDIYINKTNNKEFISQLEEIRKTINNDIEKRLTYVREKV